MLTGTTRPHSLFYFAFNREAALIKDDLLEPIDRLLDDGALIKLVEDAQAQRAPRARTMGRKTIAPDRLLRCCALKHIKNWSFRELEREVRSSLVYRRFTRFDESSIPDFCTFSRNFALLGPDVTKQIHTHIVGVAHDDDVAPGKQLRTDTTVVEANIHHPTDSTLLQDGIRVLTRAAKRLVAECAGDAGVVDHARAARRRVLEIHRAAKSLGESSRDRLEESYRKLVGLTSSVLRNAEQVADDVSSGRLPVVGSVVRVLAAEASIRHFAPLVGRVVAQTKARVFGGDTHVSGKVISLFEEHSVPIRKGKAHKPTEFGRLVRIDEVENGIVSAYDVQQGNPADVNAWAPALDEHERVFGRPPRKVTADRGYFSAKNEREAEQRGVRRVALPARGRLSKARAALQKQRWFRHLLRWRGGIEPRIATLKHRFGMVRAHYKGESGFTRFVGWSVIGQNLVSIARTQTRREANGAPKTQAA